MAKASLAAIPNQRPELAQLSDEQLKDAFYRMSLIRRFEEEAEQCYMRGLIHGTMHLSIGQEASAVGTCMALTPSDYITSTHRGHSRSDRNLYRTKEEIEEWKARCPIERLKAELTATGRIGADVLDAITARVNDEIAAAVVFAQEREAPDPSQLAEDVYA